MLGQAPIDVDATEVFVRSQHALGQADHGALRPDDKEAGPAVRAGNAVGVLVGGRRRATVRARKPQLKPGEGRLSARIDLR